MLTDDPPRTIGQHVSGQRLIWGHPTLWTFISESSFTDCDITIACSARAIGIKDCVFRGCTIRTKRPLTNFQFFDVVFDECRFIGRYPGCEFGFRSPGYEDTHARGYVRRCDFARAQLSLVTINSSEVATPDAAAVAALRAPGVIGILRGYCTGHGQPMATPGKPALACGEDSPRSPLRSWRTAWFLPARAGRARRTCGLQVHPNRTCRPTTGCT